MTKKKSNIGRHNRRRQQKPLTKDKALQAKKVDLQAERAGEAEAERCFASPAPQEVEEPVTEQLKPPPPKRRKGIDEHRRRHAINEIFVNMGQPEESTWRGNSPELMPLDSNLFADLEYAIKQHCAITHDLHKDDKRKFKLGTPGDVWHAMTRSWQMIRPERVVQDIRRWERALEKIVQARGAVVPELDTRHGRRAVPFTPHPDCEESMRVKEEKWATYAQYCDEPLP